MLAKHYLSMAGKKNFHEKGVIDWFIGKKVPCTFFCDPIRIRT